MKYDTIVIGAGPGGYVCAIRLAQLGQKVAVIEKGRSGGVCLQRGCIPSKALIHAADVMDEIRHAAEMGIEVSDVRVSIEKMQKWKSSVIDRLTKGIEGLLKANGIDLVEGAARLKDAHTVAVQTEEGGKELQADNIVLATGSSAIEIPVFPFDGKRIVGSRDALSLTEIPKRMLVIGGGYIGLELGTVYAKLGSEVIVVEQLPQLLTGTDPDMVRPVQRKLKALGVQIHLESRALSADVDGDIVRIKVETPKGEKEFEVDCLMVTVGRRPNSRDLGLEDVGVGVDSQGFVHHNDQLQTSVPNIYVIGDLAGQPMLAHKASKEGVLAAEIISGLSRAVDYVAMPAVVFTDPEIAYVGMSLQEAKSHGYDAVESTFNFSALGRALTMGKPEGLVKLVADKKTNVLLGAHIVGATASDLIGEVTLALEMGATAEDLALTIHPHPTMTEAVMEAAEGVFGHAVHQPPKKKAKKA